MAATGAHLQHGPTFIFGEAGTKKLLAYAVVAVVCLTLGMLLADTEVADVARQTAKSARSTVVEVVGNSGGVETRTMVLAENPQIISRLMKGGSFGGEDSVAAAQNMFGRTEKAIEDVSKKTHVIEVGPGSYLIRMPCTRAPSAGPHGAAAPRSHDAAAPPRPAAYPPAGGGPARRTAPG